MPSISALCEVDHVGFEVSLARAEECVYACFEMHMCC